MELVTNAQQDICPKTKNVEYEEELRLYSKYITFCNNYVTWKVLAMLIAMK